MVAFSFTYKPACQNWVRLGQWEQVSPYYFYYTTVKIGACQTSSPTQLHMLFLPKGYQWKMFFPLFFPIKY